MISDKIVEMLQGDKEMKELAMIAIEREYPAVHAALLNYTGYGTVNSMVVNTIENVGYINLGDNVRLRGLSGSPEMIVTAVTVTQTKINAPYGSINERIPSYATLINAKYWNRSKQEFVGIQDRIECFEKLKGK